MTRLRIILIAVFAVLIMTATHSFAAKIHKGTVLEAKTAGPYTYMQIKEGKEKFWIAATPNKFEKGTKVSFAEQLWMYKFKSKSMDRTFDKILFVAVVYEGDGALKTQAKTRPAPAAKSMAPYKQQKAFGTFTVEEVFTKKDELKGKSIKVKGKVVKVLQGIMGMNWIHIKDGTGAAGSDDIIFTSKRDKAVVGSTVTAQGTVIVDKDFGSGYFYPVIIQNSTFAK